MKVIYSTEGWFFKSHSSYNHPSILINSLLAVQPPTKLSHFLQKVSHGACSQSSCNFSAYDSCTLPHNLLQFMPQCGTGKILLSNTCSSVFSTTSQKKDN
jgi:hypothetical protein